MADVASPLYNPAYALSVGGKTQAEGKPDGKGKLKVAKSNKAGAAQPAKKKAKKAAKAKTPAAAGGDDGELTDESDLFSGEDDDADGDDVWDPLAEDQ